MMGDLGGISKDEEDLFGIEEELGRGLDEGEEWFKDERSAVEEEELREEELGLLKLGKAKIGIFKGEE